MRCFFDLNAGLACRDYAICEIVSRGPSGLTRLCGSKGAVLLQEGVGLESLWPVRAAWVRIPLPAPEIPEADLKVRRISREITYPGGV